MHTTTVFKKQRVTPDVTLGWKLLCSDERQLGAPIQVVQGPSGRVLRRPPTSPVAARAADDLSTVRACYTSALRTTRGDRG